jgi:hypothetical protein
MDKPLVTHERAFSTDPNEGVTMLDFFAAAFIMGQGGKNYSPSVGAVEAYKWAKEMLKERERQK